MVGNRAHMLLSYAGNTSFNDIQPELSVLNQLHFRLHYQNAIPIDGDVLLKNPIPKQKWELSSEKITMDTKIGSGQFGEVWKGTMKEDAKKPPVVVAIKVKKVTDQNKTEIDEMYKEARLMRQYKHKNVVKFYGIVNKSADKVMIVMELVIGGALDDHLRKSKDVEKIGYAIDAAVGMVYLHSKGCIHRDIACRNCLIDVKKSIVKISDFGLSKQVEVYKIQAHERLPIRWFAPEVISTRIYTAKCDVYSYGILLWEIFNNGEQPFKGMSNKIVELAFIFRTCWRADPKKRPMMTQVARFLIHAPAEMRLTGTSHKRAPSVAEAREAESQIKPDHHRYVVNLNMIHSVTYHVSLNEIN
ncbi:unnamed protein product [Angiostrongylus costaricensis]|uniref:Protein kinase domain-containing protein n=1 Tax=Angiostrongylus costaricensis TaxID=334426 RepID=A0A0R3Q0I3_ANGCS|nr:unnamed protein product [Angiostrongylus costaricensis]